MKLRVLSIILMSMTAAAFAFGQGEVDYTDPAKLAELIAGKGVPYILVDVRTPVEYASGHIPTAVNIPNTEIAARPPMDDTSVLIIVSCRSGARSASAKQTLEKLGYSNVVDFGSVSKWREGLVEGDAPTAQ
ncbi:MAG: rhodanese-like domain-containing protein [Spirochaetes bacterium]|nr:rhodanese-like domain-containing protein [Spirochaetota bacterium]